MGYRSDVRIRTSKKGFKKLYSFVEEYIANVNSSRKENEYTFDNLLKECDIKFEGKDTCYFGWDSVKWYENSGYKDVDSIMEGLDYLEKNNLSYKYARIGENYDDYDELEFESENEEYLECPYLIREFDDIVEEISKNEAQEVDFEIIN